MTRRTTNPAGVNGGARSSKSVQLGGELLQHKASPAGKQESSELPHSAGIRGLERWDIVHGKSYTAKVASFLPEYAEKLP